MRTNPLLKNSFHFLKLALFSALLLCLLTGCKVQLYAQIDEQEGNEMLALLLDNNISSGKKTEKDNMISLYVERSKLSRAVELLRRNGYPKNKFSTIKDVFSKDKLISTPFEDRIRYIYGLSQEIAETLANVDGVMTARVHVVMPEANRSGIKEPASAAVFIKHNPNYDFDAYIPQIKSIVSSGIANLSYDAVNVALFPAQHEDMVMLNPHHSKSILSIEVAPQSVARFYWLLTVLVILVLLSMAVNIYLLVRGKRSFLDDSSSASN